MARSVTIPVLAVLVAAAFGAAAIEWTLDQWLALAKPFEWRTFTKHAALVMGLQGVVLALCIIAAGLVRLLGLDRRVCRAVAATGFGLLALALLSLYVADCLSHLYIRTSVSWTVVAETLYSLPEVARSFPFTLAAVGAAWLAAAIGIAAVAWRFAGPVADLARIGSPGAVVGLLAFGAVGFYAWQDLARRPASWVNDSIARLFLDRGHLAITLTGGSPPPAPENAPDIVVILSDSLRADHFPQYGYHRQTAPFLSELAKSGHFWTIDYATSTCPRTSCGVMSVLLSNPLSRAIGRENTALQFYLRNAGYKIDFLLSGGHTEDTVEAVAFGSPARYDLFSDARLTGRGNDDGQVLDGLDRLAERGREPHLVFVFLMSSHLSGRKLPAFRKFQPETSIIDPLRRYNPAPLDTNPLSAADREALANSYDNGILQTDDYIRRIFDKLTAKGYLRNSLVFISSDHGEALGEHGKFAHGSFIFPENLRVPLFIYDTSGRRYPADRFASITDIAATAVARVGLPVPATWDGIDIAGPEGRQWSFAENYQRDDGPCRGVYRRTTDRLYYLMNCLGDGERFFDLTADPLGATNLLATVDPGLLAEMRRRLQERYPVYRTELIWLP